MKSRIVQVKTIAVALLATCVTGAVSAQQKPVKIIQRADTLITRNTTWDADTVYFMKGKVYVTNNAELTIQPGTVIMGDTISKGTLIITRGSKIHATGTSTCPIVFTSSKGTNKRNRGDWGGLIILGSASVNTPTGTANIEGLPPSALTTYGGGLTPNDNDNSGDLSFVRVEFAGVALAPNNEINGVTFGGVGRGTLVDFVQVSYSNDDSFEWFGGTVNCKHLIAFRGLDDDFDTDFGYSGKIQFGIGIRDPQVADVSGSNGFESDNDAAGSSNLPQTKAVFSNMTLVAGADSATNALFRNSAQIRRNSHMYLYNSIVMGYPTGILIDGTSTNSSVQVDTMVQDNIVAATQSSKWVSSTTANTAVTNLLLNNAGNRFFTGNTAVRLTNPYFLNNPNLRPAAGSPALSGGDFNHIGLKNDPFFTPTAYVGALAKAANQNWAAVWVNFKPTNGNYFVINAACATTFGAEAAAVNAIASDDIQVAKAATSVYPNPAKGAFKVNLSGFSSNTTIKVINMNGVVVYNKPVANAKASVADVTLSNAPAGVYFVTVSDSKRSVTHKINIIQ